MVVADRLRRRRERFALTQEWVARAMGIPRELLSYWETGARQPGPQHLRDLARIYRTTPERLLAAADELDGADPLEFFDDTGLDAQTTTSVRAWSAFLGRWSTFLADDLGMTLPGPSRPPAALAEPTIVVDRRRASALAAKVRAHWGLGQLALPELYGFLDQQDILIQRMVMGPIEATTGGISGVFHNHAELGFCVVVNAHVSAARQVFTLAHGVAHALFHHAEVGILCRVTADDRVESFADAFAEHFLVPRNELRRQTARMLEGTRCEALEPVHALGLASVFRVSFPTIVMRLASEGLIGGGMLAAWHDIDGVELARRLGVAFPAFPAATERPGPLGPYPASVLATVKRALAQGAASIDRVAEVLDVRASDIEQTLLAPAPTPSPAERREHDEFAQVLAKRG